MASQRERTTPPRAPSVELRVVEAVIRVASVLAIVAFVWMLAGNNGFGVVQSFGMPGSPQEAAMVTNERVTLRGAPALASVEAANTTLGSLESRSSARAAEVAPSQAGPLVELTGPTQASATFWDATGTQRWAWILVRALAALCSGAALWLLADIVKSARSDPFTSRNVHRLGAMTALVAVAGVAGDWGTAAVRWWLISSSDAGDTVRLDLDVSFGFVALVLGLGVVTVVWRRGVAMREDLVGLV
jgi:hypothetical protein